MAIVFRQKTEKQLIEENEPDGTPFIFFWLFPLVDKKVGLLSYQAGNPQSLQRDVGKSHGPVIEGELILGWDSPIFHTRGRC